MPNIPTARMYKTTVLLLILVVAGTSLFLREFPYSVIIAAAACSIVEMALNACHFKTDSKKIPYTTIITGIIIGAVASSNAPVLLLVLASVAAMLSRAFLRYKGSNIFNPAVIGLLIALIIFRAGDDWWIAGAYPVFGILIALTPLLVICAWEGRRLAAGLSFAITSFVVALLLGGLKLIHSPLGIWTAIISINYFLAFVMVAEPKTSPNKRNAQIVYGVGIALLVTLLTLYRIPYPLLIPLFVGNLGYLAYRIKTKLR